ncbi:hypothetical protein H4R18_001163 [Coemansia javaensis]|uniref:Uncharacterized protein n=1 Tax=Coemansia javaensis TaxID=2761396 RepID=A0A9W8HIY3_9FUNG|nr:hypothetical protein H4R18_001163 [Coemansia javaensis]
MDPIVTGSLSYQMHISGRRLSLASPLPDSAPCSPVDAPQRPGVTAAAAARQRFGAIEYTYTCDKCGFGTNLLSSFMPHASNPCDAPAAPIWSSC